MLTDDEIAKLCQDPFGEALLLKEYPVELSRSPQNTIYHYCDVYQGRSSYAACLHFLDANIEGRGYLRPDCEVAVKKGICPAVKMRKRELQAGRALYYVNYQEIGEMRRVAYEREAAESPIQFRKNKTPTKFIPIAVIPTDESAAEQAPLALKVKSKPQPRVKKRDSVPAPTLMDQEIETNIMQKVLEKRLENE